MNGECNRWTAGCDCVEGFEGEFCENIVTFPPIIVETTVMMTEVETAMVESESEVDTRVENDHCEYFGDNFEIGERLKMHCLVGYQLDGPEQIECTGFGWEPELDTSSDFVTFKKVGKS